MSVLTTIPWRLGPANPLLLRVVTAGGRRWRHAVIRWIYLGLLIAVLLVALLLASANAGSLSELAKAATRVFRAISYVQLGMICLLGPVFTAGAITQERDSRTYSILLATPLSNGQIVLGSLLSRLYYIVVLLLSGVPVFAITLFYGGVTARGILLSFGIALATAVFMGALAITIAVLRVGSARTVFWFYFFNAVYLVGVGLIDPSLSGPSGHTTVLTSIHPFLALQSVVNPTAYPVPDPAELAGHSLLVRLYLGYPAQAFLVMTFALSALLVGVGTLTLRYLAQRAASAPWRRLLQRLFGLAKTRRPRSVWKSPIAWREAMTRGGTVTRGLTRWVAILLGIVGAGLVIWGRHTGALDVDLARQAITGTMLVVFTLTLLLAANIAAAAITREQESQTLDLFLVTPLTSRDYVEGKFRGVLLFLLPLVVVPPVCLGFVVLDDLLTGRLSSEPSVFPETLLALPVFTGIFTVLACLLGLISSLRWSRTVTSVMATVGALGGIATMLGFCGFATMQVTGLGIVANALSPFTGLLVLLNPWSWARPSMSAFSADSGFSTPTVRIMIAGSVLISALLYGFLAWLMYRWLLRNFDLVLRRQRR